MRVSIEINADEKGYIDKECPFPECKYHFKVNAEDWKDKFRDEAVCSNEVKRNSSQLSSTDSSFLSLAAIFLAISISTYFKAFFA